MLPDYHFAVARSPAVFDELAAEWNELQRPWQMPMLDAQWFQTNAEHFYGAGDLHVVTARREGRLVGVAPLARSRRRGLKRLEFIGASPTPGPCGLLYREPADLQALITRLWLVEEPMTLRAWASDDPLPLSRGIRFGRRGVRVWRSTSRTPTLAIKGTWEDFLGAMTAQRRYDIRRSRRRLQARGAVSTVFEYPAPGQVDEFLDRAFKIEAASWKGRRGTALVDNPRRESFFRAVSRHYAGRRELLVAFLLTGETPVAMQIGVVRAGRYWILRVGYDEACSRASPGSLLMTEAVRYAHQRGLERVEFLGEPEPWLRAWTREWRECRRVHFLPYGWAGVRSLASLSRPGGRSHR